MVNLSAILALFLASAVLQAGSDNSDSSDSSDSNGYGDWVTPVPRNVGEVCLLSCYCDNDHDSVCALTLPKDSPQPHQSGPQYQPRPQNQPERQDGFKLEYKPSNTAVAVGAAAAGAAGAAAAAGAYYNKDHQQKPQQQHQQQKQPDKSKYERDYSCDWCMRSECNPGACKAIPDFDADKDAKALRDAMKGLGTKENVLIDILTHRSEEQLEQIRRKYQGFGTHLDKDVIDDTSMKIKDLFVALLQHREDFFADELNRAFSKRDTSAMTMILTSLSPCAVRQIGSAYYRQYKTPLVDAAKKKSNGKFQQFLVELIKGNRAADGQIDEALAKKDAEALIKAGPKAWFKGKDVFIDIFTHRSYSHIRKVKEEYNKLRPKPGLDEDILKHSGGGELTKGLSVMLKNINNQPEYFADEIEGAARPLISPGIRDNTALIRILRGRCGIDLGDIRDVYPKTHDNKPLVKLVKERATGDYEKALIQLVTEQNV